MQIVIDIDDRVYGLLKYFDKSLGLNDEEDSDDVKTALMRAVINGTPLPKGHGRLIDADAFCERYDSNINGNIDGDYIFAPTIVETDKAESENGE